VEDTTEIKWGHRKGLPAERESLDAKKGAPRLSACILEEALAVSNIVLVYCLFVLL